MDEDVHWRHGRLLLEERQQRYRFWLLTDDEMDGEAEFLSKCARFDRHARHHGMPTLKSIAIVDTCPND